jgi:cell division protein FtsB
MGSFLPADEDELEFEPAMAPEAKAPGGVLSVLADRIPWFASCVVILGIMGYIFLSDSGPMRNSGLAETKVSLEEEVRRLEEENRQLSIRLERIRSDPGFLEDEARKKLGLVRPDETIYRLAEEPDISDEELRGQLK